MGCDGKAPMRMGPVEDDGSPTAKSVNCGEKRKLELLDERTEWIDGDGNSCDGSGDATTLRPRQVLRVVHRGGPSDGKVVTLRYFDDDAGRVDLAPKEGDTPFLADYKAEVAAGEEELRKCWNAIRDLDKKLGIGGQAATPSESRNSVKRAEEEKPALKNDGS